MSVPEKKKALIIGGGIGGLCTAIALRRVGIDATVYEHADVIRPLGSGLSLWANAVWALHKLGLAEQLAEIGQPFTGGILRSWRNVVLAETPADALVKRYGPGGRGGMMVHRGELQEMLLETLADGVVQLNSLCTGFKQDGTGVWAQFADGREVFGDLLIGADGIHSTIRAQLFGNTKPHYSGYTDWLGVARVDDKPFPPGTIFELFVFGRGGVFGVTPLNHGRVYWFAQLSAPEGMHEQGLSRKQEVLKYFGDWHEPVPAIIEATEEDALLRSDVYEHLPLKHWTKGRVTLLGDAAHAMTPNLGQGACQAIEDAVVLARCLQEKDDVTAALQLYEARRMQRTYAVLHLAHVVGQVTQLKDPAVSLLRDKIVKSMPPDFHLKQFDWLLGYKV